MFVIDNAYTEKDCRLIAAALEHASTHPLARAFAMQDALPVCHRTNIVVGQGVSGIIDGREWRIGNAEFVGGVARSY